MAKSKLAKIHAILGRSHRTGRWRLSPKTSIVALLGSCRLDLREAHLDDDVSKMTAMVLLGGVTVIIPPGVEVRPSGLSLLGGASVDVPPFDDEATTLIEIEWTSVFGRLRIGAADEGDESAPEEANDGARDPEPNGVAAAPPVAAPEPGPTGPEPAIGFDDLDTPEPAEPQPAIDFDDLDTPEPAEPQPAIDFDDLDGPAEDGAATPNRRADDPQPADGEHEDEGSDAGTEAAAEDRSEPADEIDEIDEVDEIDHEQAPAAVGLNDR